MLNRTIALVLLFAFAGSAFSGIIVKAGFNLNKKYISSVLCENINKPWKHCNGKCYLMKKIRQSEQRQNGQQEQQNQKNNTQEGVCHADFKFIFLSVLLTIISTPYCLRHVQAPIAAILLPPK